MQGKEPNCAPLVLPPHASRQAAVPSVSTPGVPTVSTLHSCVAAALAHGASRAGDTVVAALSTARQPVPPPLTSSVVEGVGAAAGALTLASVESSTAPVAPTYEATTYVLPAPVPLTVAALEPLALTLATLTFREIHVTEAPVTGLVIVALRDADAPTRSDTDVVDNVSLDATGATTAPRKPVFSRRFVVPAGTPTNRPVLALDTSVVCTCAGVAAVLLLR